MGITYEKIAGNIFGFIDVNTIKVESPTENEILEVLDELFTIGSCGRGSDVALGICKLFPEIYEKTDLSKQAEDILKIHEKQGYLTPDQFWHLLDVKGKIQKIAPKKFKYEIKQVINAT